MAGGWLDVTAATPTSGSPAGQAVPAAVLCDPTQTKAFANLRASAALAGFTLCAMTETDGQRFYLLSRWGMSRTLPDLAAVVAFLRQVGAPE